MAGGPQAAGDKVANVEDEFARPLFRSGLWKRRKGVEKEGEGVYAQRRILRCVAGGEDSPLSQEATASEGGRLSEDTEAEGNEERTMSASRRNSYRSASGSSPRAKSLSMEAILPDTM